MLNCGEKLEDLPKNIDHLVYTSPSLEEGIKEIESLLGVKPVLGGKHPNYGTHNALLSLGPSMYLEIIAPEPNLPIPEKGRLLSNNYNGHPKLSTWVLREEQIEAMQLHAVQNGLSLGEVESGKREKPDGTTLAWKLTDPYALPMDGAIPFLISWGETSHPAKTLPRAGELIGLEIHHPDPNMVREGLKVLGVYIKIIRSKEIKIRAKIKTGQGIVYLE